MKKSIILIAMCIFTFISAQAQSSEVEIKSQVTKADQFKTDNNFIKESEIYKNNINLFKVFVKLFTDLKSGEQLVALEFPGLGYLDMDQVDDFILALETILNEYKSSNKKDKYTISYTTSNGIDVFYNDVAKPMLTFRKKWFVVDDYGVQTCKYSQDVQILFGNDLPALIEAIKEAKVIANQFMVK